jgi:calmodulin
MADIPENELKELRENFSLFDKDNVGSISLDEMMIIYRAMGQTPTEADVEAMKQEADVERSGRVGLETFVSVYSKYRKNPITENEILNAFEELDERKRGQISAKRLRHLISTCGENLSEEEINKMMKYAKPDEEGNVSYREFVKVMMSK